MQNGRPVACTNLQTNKFAPDEGWSPAVEEVTCPACLESMAAQGLVTYSVTEDRSGNAISITCLHCNRTSHNAQDIQNHYCGGCCMFHDDIWPPARLGWIRSPVKGKV